MKKQRFFGMALLIMGVLLIFSMMGCELFFPEPDPDPDDKDKDVNISSINGLNTYLQSQPQNTADEPYTVNLNVSDLGANTSPNGGVSLTGQAIIDAGRYVSLDLSGSTFTSIEDGAFNGCKTLTSITLPDSVTSIGQTAFANCDSLTSVNIPASVTSIGTALFGLSGVTTVTVDANNPNYSSEGGILYDKNKTTLVAAGGGITSVTIPASVTSIGDGAFTGCVGGIGDITIPNGVTSIGANAFALSGITSVTIPDSVTTIGSGAFGFSGITSATIGNGVESIKGLFGLTPNLETLTLGSGVTEITPSDFMFSSSLTTVTIHPNNTTYASDDGVVYNKAKTEIILVPQGKTSVIIPDTITKIGSSDFSYCTKLTSITIPATVTEIASGAFSSLNSLTNITIEAGNPSFEKENNVLYNKGKTTLIMAFKGITSVTIPNSVTSIESNAFSRCVNLTSVTFGSGAASIGDSAFYGCTELADITIGGGVTSVGGSAFSGCTSLESVTFGTSVTSIGFYAFYGCTNLASVTFEGTISTTQFSNSAFPSNGNLRAKFYASNSSTGTPGTYTTTAPVSENSVWTLLVE